MTGRKKTRTNHIAAKQPLYQ